MERVEGEKRRGKKQRNGVEGQGRERREQEKCKLPEKGWKVRWDVKRRGDEYVGGEEVQIRESRQWR